MKGVRVSAWISFAAFIVSAASSSAAETGDKNRWPKDELPVAGGAQASIFSLRGEKGTAVVTLSIDCPISNGYSPTLQRLAADYAKQGIAFIGLHAGAGHALKDIEHHRREYGLTFPILKDPGAACASQLGLTVSPEVCLFDSAGAIRYRGRIDDRYPQRGAAPREPQSHDLRTAIDALLAGKVIAKQKTEAVGCPIVATRPSSDSKKSGEVTWSRHVAKIVQQNCVECHRSGGIGPFSLTKYDDAVLWADDIRSFTARKIMPPWKPVAGHGEFQNNRSMSDADIATIGAWVEAGCPQGDPAEAPPPREFHDGWKLGEPDAIVTPAEEYTVGAEGPDEYRCFVLPTNWDADRYVTAFEIRPGNSRIVHHVLVFLDITNATKQLDAADPGPGYSSGQGFPGFFPSGTLGGWAPGNTRARLTEGMVRVLPKGVKLVMQVHYHRSGKVERDRTELGLHFSKTPPTRSVRSVPLMPPGAPFGGLTIAAGDPKGEGRGKFVMPGDGRLVAITPHMHLLGRKMQVDATLPDGKVLHLLRVDDWDFNWQETYHYREPIKLPKGTRIDMVAEFDNSAANPRNPNRPPQEVNWGEETKDEMCIAFLELAPEREAKSPAELRTGGPSEALRFLLRQQMAPWEEAAKNLFGPGKQEEKR